MGATYRADGPLFDGTAPHILDVGIKAIEEGVAVEGQRRVRQRLGTVLKHPTGHYSSRVVVDLSFKGYEVTDSGVVYGPWLEGVGSRNSRSRFKGYSTFRKVGQQLEAQAVEVAQPETAQMLQKLRG